MASTDASQDISFDAMATLQKQAAQIILEDPAVLSLAHSSAEAGRARR